MGTTQREKQAADYSQTIQLRDRLNGHQHKSCPFRS